MTHVGEPEPDYKPCTKQGVGNSQDGGWMWGELNPRREITTAGDDLLEVLALDTDEAELPRRPVCKSCRHSPGHLPRRAVGLHRRQRSSAVRASPSAGRSAIGWGPRPARAGAGGRYRRWRSGPLPRRAAVPVVHRPSARASGQVEGGPSEWQTGSTSRGLDRRIEVVLLVAAQRQTADLISAAKASSRPLMPHSAEQRQVMRQ